MVEEWKEEMYRTLVQEFWDRGIELEDEQVINSHLVEYLGIDRKRAEEIRNEIYMKFENETFIFPGILYSGRPTTIKNERLQSEFESTGDLEKFNRLASIYVNSGDYTRALHILEKNVDLIDEKPDGRMFYELWRTILLYLSEREEDILDGLKRLCGMALKGRSSAIRSPLALAAYILLMHSPQDDETFFDDIIEFLGEDSPEGRIIMAYRAHLDGRTEEAIRILEAVCRDV